MGLFLLNACASRNTSVAMWLHDKIPSEICSREPGLLKIGIFRTLNDGTEEFLSYCSDGISDFLGLDETSLRSFVVPKDTSHP